MTQISSIDFSTKRIFLHLDTVTSGFDGTAAHFEVKALVQASSVFQGHPMPTSAEGNIPKGGGNYTARYLYLKTAWRLVPYGSVSHRLDLLSEIISEDEITDSSVFDRSTISPSIYVDIATAYDKIEIREISTGSVLSDEEKAELSLASQAAAANTKIDSIPTAAQNADKLLGRSIQGGADGGRTVTQALRANRNRVDLVTGDIYEEDDTTISHSYTVSRAPLDAVSEVDPT